MGRRRRWRPSRPKERCGNHRNTVLAAIRLVPRSDDHSVEQVVANLIAEPTEMTQVVVRHNSLELHLDRQDAPVVAFDDQIDLVLAALGPQMPDRRLGRLGEGPHAERHEGFEQGSEKRTVPLDGRAGRTARQQTVRTDVKRAWVVPGGILGYLLDT